MKNLIFTFLCVFTFFNLYSQPPIDIDQQINNLNLNDAVGSTNFTISIDDIFNNQINYGNCCNMMSDPDPSSTNNSSLCYCTQEVTAEIEIQPYYNIYSSSDPNDQSHGTYVYNNHVYNDQKQKEVSIFVSGKIKDFFASNNKKMCSIKSVEIVYDFCPCLTYFSMVIRKIKIKYCQEVPCPVPCDSY